MVERLLDPATYEFVLAFSFDGGKVVESDLVCLSGKVLRVISTQSSSKHSSSSMLFDPGTYEFVLAFSVDGGKVVDSDFVSLSGKAVRVMSTHSSSSFLFALTTYVSALAFS